jgi:DNA-binding Lrp family transcriptional regulator
MTLDSFDRQLLTLVQEDAEQTAEQLSAVVALSPSAIQRRLRRLREEGVIARTIGVVDPGKIGGPTFFIVGLHVERERPELLTELRRWLRAEPAVQQAFYVTGEADFIIVMTATDTAAFESMMSRLMEENANVSRFTTNVALGAVKRGLFVPVPKVS